jgi:hypothetical protein
MSNDGVAEARAGTSAEVEDGTGEGVGPGEGQGVATPGEEAPVSATDAEALRACYKKQEQK